MELVSQHTKSIMEGCKERARRVGLSFEDESLEYIVTNRDMLELTPKNMIPTLYDYWVHDVEVLKEKGRYELYPSNPYETVINTRPAISYYNDNNPDWMNVMIFYHVLAHIDFFQNNLFFRHTWDYDLTGQALADKRLIASLRSRHGRWVDYVIEFSRGIDNLVGYFDELSRIYIPGGNGRPSRLDYYFDVFLQSERKVRVTEYVKEVKRYNECVRRDGDLGEQTFFADTVAKYPEFEALFVKSRETKPQRRQDLMQYLMENSDFLNREENTWMKSVIQIVRKTSIYFQPQIRSKIMNEGWASYWHEKLFMQDERIRGHEVEYARVHSAVASLPRVGLNPYALGMRMFQNIEEMADRGKFSAAYRRLLDADARHHYNLDTGKGQETIFRIRENYSDFLFLSDFIDQEFVDRHRLFVTERRLNQERMVWQYVVRSRKAEDYRQMLLNQLYHPPRIEIDREKSAGNLLYLVHRFEGKPLVQEYIPNTLLGIEFLWGGAVRLETSEPVRVAGEAVKGGDVEWRRVVYEMKDRKLSKTPLF